MKKVLEEINKTKGVLGSLIVGGDGMIVLSALPTEYDQDYVSALVASAVDTANKAISGIDDDEFKMCIIEGNDKNLFIFNTKIGFLFVMSKVSTNMGLIRVECKKSVAKINQF